MTPVSLEGQSLGKYRVLEPLGRGGMARVYRAYHPQLDRYVAIKVMRSDLVDERELDAGSWRARFRREAQAVAALRHPNIVQVFDSDVQDDVYYIVLELLGGDTLKTRLNDYRIRGERIPQGEMVRILLDVLNGLAYAHSEGMIHRDVKPANILLTKRGQAVVADFGIARIVGGTRHTMSGALMGTLDYMAPEQGMEGRGDIRSDIYSLGIVFYEMLAQRTPFEADTPLAVLMKHINDPLPLPRKIDPTIPESFERVVLKALAKDPDDRYQSAAEMAQALRQAAEEAEVDLPARISLPLSFTTAEVPSESVAVFSGTAREKITDSKFADDDTDATLGQKLTAEQTDEHAGKELLDAMGALGRMVAGKAAQAIQEAVEEEEGKSPEPPAETETASSTPPLAAGRAKKRRGSVGIAILGAMGLLIIGNLIMVTMAAPTDHWQIFEQGWPIEIFLLSWGLCIIMYITSSIWMLIPIGLVLGNGMMLAYCWFTNNWEQWSFLWLYEMWIVAVSVFAPIWLAKNKTLSRVLSRLLALSLSLISIACIVVVGWPFGLDRLIIALNSFIITMIVR